MSIFGKSYAQLERDNADLNRKVDMMENQVNSANETARRAKHDLARLQSERSLDAEEVALEHKLEIAELTNSHKAELADIKASTDAQIVENDSAHEVELRTAERRIEALESDSEEAVAQGVREATAELMLYKTDFDAQLEAATTKVTSKLEAAAKASEASRDAELKAAKKALRDEFVAENASLIKKCEKFAEAADFNKGVVEGLRGQISSQTKMIDFMSGFTKDNFAVALGKLADVSFHVENPAPVMLAPAAPKGDGKQNNGGSNETKK